MDENSEHLSPAEIGQLAINNSLFVQTIPAALHHLLPDGYSPVQLAAWIEQNQRMLSTMSARQIAIEGGYLKSNE